LVFAQSAMPQPSGTAGAVKVFGCREANENRPSTNPRAGGDGLWGFGLLPSRGDGGDSVAMASTWVEMVWLMTGLALNRQFAAADVPVSHTDFSHRRASIR
jgi:hypothetical protein